MRYGFGNNGFSGGGSAAGLRSAKNYAAANKFLGNHRQQKPVPPLADYEAYRATIDKRAQHSFNPAKVRRIVILMREGRTRSEAGGMIGYSMGKETFEKMPEHLR